MERGCQQNNILADGYARRLMAGQVAKLAEEAPDGGGGGGGGSDGVRIRILHRRRTTCARASARGHECAGPSQA